MGRAAVRGERGATQDASKRQIPVVQAVVVTCMSLERKRNGRCGHALAQGAAGDRRTWLSSQGRNWPKWQMRRRAGRTEIGSDVCVWPNETNESCLYSHYSPRGAAPQGRCPQQIGGEARTPGLRKWSVRWRPAKAVAAARPPCPPPPASCLLIPAS